MRLAEAARYESLGTFEFLVDAGDAGDGFVFIEANPRLQVEHTVTEEVTGVDLVEAQLRLAAGDARSKPSGLRQATFPSRAAWRSQVRVNMETMRADGTATPAGGTLTAFEPPSGPGVRVDTLGYAGYDDEPALRLAARQADRALGLAGASRALVARAYRALGEFRIEGVATNLAFLQALLRHPAVAANEIHTRFVEEHAAELAPAASDEQRRLFFESSTARPAQKLAGARVDARRSARGARARQEPPRLGGGRAASPSAAPAGAAVVRAPMQGTIVAHRGRRRRRGARGSAAARDGSDEDGARDRGRDQRRRASASRVARGRHRRSRAILLVFARAERRSTARREAAAATVDLDAHPARTSPRCSSATRSGSTTARPDAVARRRKTGQRTARENVDDLCDPGTFVEYGPLVIAAQRARRTLEDLIAAHARRRPGRRHRQRERAALRADAARAAS